MIAQFYRIRLSRDESWFVAQIPNAYPFIIGKFLHQRIEVRVEFRESIIRQKSGSRWEIKPPTVDHRLNIEEFATIHQRDLVPKPV